MIWPATPTGSRKVKLSAFAGTGLTCPRTLFARDRKSTRLNSSHVSRSYAVFCLKKKNLHQNSPVPGQAITYSTNYLQIFGVTSPIQVGIVQSLLLATAVLVPPIASLPTLFSLPS